MIPAPDVTYMTELLVNLCHIPSPSGNTGKAIAWLEQEFRRLGLDPRTTNKGALIVTIPGADNLHHRTLSAHVDTLGAMVKEIKPTGRLRFTPVGWCSMQSVEGEYCTIEATDGHTYTGTILTTKASAHVYADAVKLERKEENMEIRLDERVSSREDVEKLGIQVGDFVSFDPRTEVAGGFIKSRHLDDKAGVAALLGAAKLICDKRIPLAATTHLLISNYEEIGHGASAGVPRETTEFIAVDMAAIGEGQSSDEFSVTVCAKDSGGPYDLVLRRKLVDLARAEGITHQVDIYPFYGSDAGAALRAGGDFAHGLIGPGVDASHSYERTHQDALVNTAHLIVAYLKA